MKKISNIADYLATNPHYSKEIELLREIISDYPELSETFKWSSPTYTVNKKNVIAIGAFKNHIALWFFNGVFIDDKHNLLINASEDKTKGLRQIRFENISEIEQKRQYLDYYIRSAIENQLAGMEIKPEKVKHGPAHPMLQQSFEKDPQLKAAFDKLTPFKQREYSEYLDSAKREATKATRLEKILPMIAEGRGLNDRYR